MDTTSTMGFLDLLVVAAAVYILYSWAQLHFNGKITSGLLVSKACNTSKCKDKEAYKKEMGWKTLLTGLLCLLSGGIGLYQDYVQRIPQAIYWACFALFMVVLIWFGWVAKKAEEKYF